MISGGPGGGGMPASSARRRARRRVRACRSAVIRPDALQRSDTRGHVLEHLAERCRAGGGMRTPSPGDVLEHLTRYLRRSRGSARRCSCLSTARPTPARPRARASSPVICGGSGGGGMLDCRRSDTRAATCSSISPVISGATVCTCTLAFSRSASSSATWPATSPRHLRRRHGLDANAVLQPLRHEVRDVVEHPLGDLRRDRLDPNAVRQPFGHDRRDVIEHRLA